MSDCILIWFRANLGKGWTNFLWLRFLEFELLSTYLKGVWRFEKEEGAVDKSVVHSVMCWMPLFIRGRGGAPPPHCPSAQQCARTSRPLTVTRASTVSALSAFVYLTEYNINRVPVYVFVCLWVVYHFYSQRVVCSVPFSVLDNRLPPNHLTAPHSARPLLDFRITSRKWVCSTCVKLSCAVFLLSQR